MKILLIALSGIGDTLCSTPLIKELRKNLPKAKIDVLTMWKSSKEILKNNPNINNIYYFNMIKKGYLKTLLFCLKLRKNNYNLSINTYPQSKIHYEVIAKLIGAKKRIGHSYDNFTFIDKLLLTKQINQDYNIHFIENNLNLLKLIDLKSKLKKHNYDLYFSKNNLKYSREFLFNNKLNNKILFSISVGSGSTKNMALRRWPIFYYKILIKSILKQDKKINILLFCGPEEIKENKLLIKKLNNKRVFLIQSENIMDSAAILSKSKFFLSIDNVLMHIAAALKIPHQFVIQTPSLNNTSEPYKGDYILIGKKVPKNIGYKYNGKGIYGKEKNITNYMRGITPKKAYLEIKKHLE